MMDPPKEPEWWFPFEGMDIGDSFFIPTLRPAEMIYLIDTKAKEVGLKMRCFNMTEKGFMGVRAWRVG